MSEYEERIPSAFGAMASVAAWLRKSEERVARLEADRAVLVKALKRAVEYASTGCSEDIIRALNIRRLALEKVGEK